MYRTLNFLKIRNDSSTKDEKVATGILVPNAALKAAAVLIMFTSRILFATFDVHPSPPFNDVFVAN